MYAFVRLRWGVCVWASDSLGGGQWEGGMCGRLSETVEGLGRVIVIMLRLSLP